MLPRWSPFVHFDTFEHAAHSTHGRGSSTWDTRFHNHSHKLRLRMPCTGAVARIDRVISLVVRVLSCAVLSPTRRRTSVPRVSLPRCRRHAHSPTGTDAHRRRLCSAAKITRACSVWWFIDCQMRQCILRITLFEQQIQISEYFPFKVSFSCDVLSYQLPCSSTILKVLVVRGP